MHTKLTMLAFLWPQSGQINALHAVSTRVSFQMSSHYRPIFTARLAKRVKVMFSLCVSVHRGRGAGGGGQGGPGGPCPGPPRNKTNGQNFGQKLDKHFGNLEVGGAGGTPLAVTQEDCLVIYVVKGKILMILFQLTRLICFTFPGKKSATTLWNV